MNHSFLKNPELDLESVKIETPRCMLEPFHTEWIDFDDLLKAFLEVNENFYVNKFRPTREQNRNIIKQIIRDRHHWTNFTCYIFHKETGMLLGCMGITALDTPEPNLGIWIRKEFQNKWYGIEVYTAFLDWAKESTNFSFFKHVTKYENTASIRLVEHFQGKLQETLSEEGNLKYYIEL